MKSKRVALFVVAGVLIIALLAACSSSSLSSAKPSTGSGGKSFDVTTTEFAFAPNSFNAKPGDKLTFKVTNKGTVEHTFVIQSPDGSTELAKLSAQPGETKTLEYTPQAAGTYPIVCDIAGHKESGMVGSLVVQ